MIASRCNKCKNIGCNNNNLLCNNWSEEKRADEWSKLKSTDIDAPIEWVLNKTDGIENLQRYAEWGGDIKKDDEGEYLLRADVLAFLAENKKINYEI